MALASVDVAVGRPAGLHEMTDGDGAVVAGAGVGDQEALGDAVAARELDEERPVLARAVAGEQARFRIECGGRRRRGRDDRLGHGRLRGGRRGLGDELRGPGRLRARLRDPRDGGEKHRKQDQYERAAARGGRTGEPGERFGNTTHRERIWTRFLVQRLLPLDWLACLRTPSHAVSRLPRRRGARPSLRGPAFDRRRSKLSQSPPASAGPTRPSGRDGSRAGPCGFHPERKSAGRWPGRRGIQRRERALPVRPSVGLACHDARRRGPGPLPGQTPLGLRLLGAEPPPSSQPRDPRGRLSRRAGPDARSHPRHRRPDPRLASRGVRGRPRLARAPRAPGSRLPDPGQPRLLCPGRARPRLGSLGALSARPASGRGRRRARALVDRAARAARGPAPRGLSDAPDRRSGRADRALLGDPDADLPRRGRARAAAARATPGTPRRARPARALSRPPDPPSGPSRRRAPAPRALGRRRVPRILAQSGAELVLHGHKHLRRVHFLDGPSKPIPAIGVPSSSEVGSRPERQAQYHVYAIRALGPGLGFEISAEVRGFDPAQGRFVALPDRLF
jgi:hypothetical protein